MFFSAEGKKAHWALLTGLLWASGPTPVGDSSPATDLASSCPAADDETQLEPDGQLLLLARQSKSLVLGTSWRFGDILTCFFCRVPRLEAGLTQLLLITLGAWLREELMASCRNLRTVASHRNTEDYMVRTSLYCYLCLFQRPLYFSYSYCTLTESYLVLLQLISVLYVKILAHKTPS
jgi:hypothetical protein